MLPGWGFPPLILTCPENTVSPLTRNKAGCARVQIVTLLSPSSEIAPIPSDDDVIQRAIELACPPPVTHHHTDADPDHVARPFASEVRTFPAH